MRIALLFAIALASSACAKKSKAAAPAAPAAAPPAATESAPGGVPSDDKPADSADESGPKKPGDPCDGGENK
jgi:hypothetical protein